MTPRLTIGLLASEGSPILGRIVDALESAGLFPSGIVLDEKPFPAEILDRWEERTRGQLPVLPPERHGHIPVDRVKGHNDPQCRDEILSRGFDLLVNAGTLRILKEPVLTAPRLGILNVHPGLLPRFRGCTCVEWAIYLDEPVGNSVHFMTTGIDEGPVVLTESYTFKKTDRYSDVRTTVFQQGFALLATAIQRIAAEGLSPDTLPPQQNGRYFDVIDDDKYNAVLSKLDQGSYRYQS